jgi:predicted  nucleic acid-binding Zn-ribbon protein
MDGIVIDASLPEQIDLLIRKIRSHNDFRIYLKPLFLIDTYEELSQLKNHCDGVADLVHFKKVAVTTSAINKNIAKISESAVNQNEKLNKLLRVLRIMFTRNRELTPFTTRTSKIAYSYPVMLEKDFENLGLIELLKLAEEENYVTPKTIDNVHLCKSCSGNYLNFREVCPKCQHIDMESQPLIHHFVCANVGPEKDYHKDGELICPKCDKLLRHIGIDYDKPSVIHQCNNCNEHFQQLDMTASCMDCGSDNMLSELEELKINQYLLTAQGENVATEGLKQEKFNTQDESPAGTVSARVMELMVEQEIKRAEFANIQSYLGHIQITGSQIENYNAQIKQVIQKEVITIIKSYLRPVDIISLDNLSNIKILLSGIAQTELEEIKELLDYNLHKLLGDNIGEDQLEIKFQWKALGENKEDRHG